MSWADEQIDQYNRKRWGRIRAEHESVHRGFALPDMEDDDYDLIHDTSRPMHERASHLLHLCATGDHGWGREHESGLGTHWSTDENVAHHFAKTNAREQQKYDWQADGEKYGYDGEFERQRPETRVVMHAHFPEHEHIAHNEEDQDGGVFDYDAPNDLHPINGGGARYEREVPIKKRQPVRVHAISWGKTSHVSESEAPHDRETTRYDFPEPVTHEAARRTAELPDFTAPFFHFREGGTDGGPPNHTLELHSLEHGEIGHIAWRPHDGDIRMIQVGSEHRRKGYGSMLVSKAVEVADARGLARPNQAEEHTDDGQALDDKLRPGGYEGLPQAPRNWRGAAREPGSVDCWVCGASGHDDAEGMECGACDGSGYLTPGEQREVGARCPCGEKVRKDTSGDLTHLDGSVSHDDGESVSEKMRGQRTAARAYPPRRYEHTGVPYKRIFGPTHGLDRRLFDGDHLKNAIRVDLLAKWGTFCHLQGLREPDGWAIVYFAGSEASEWTGEDRVGNNDFDVLVGVDAMLFDSANPRSPLAGLGQELLSAELTSRLRETPGMVQPDYHIPGGTDDFDQTWYVNADSYDIVKIKPYAAYDVTHDRWAVKPPHLPGWKMSDFPEGPGLEDYCWGLEDMARATLDMPSPYRYQEGFALWEFVHSNRSDAFGPQGEGWFDVRNVVEKWLDQKGLMQPLWQLHQDAVNNPRLLDAPADWSNTPVMAMLVRSMLSHRVPVEMSPTVRR